jgi:AhpC/TSA family
MLIQQGARFAVPFVFEPRHVENIFLRKKTPPRRRRYKAGRNTIMNAPMTSPLLLRQVIPPVTARTAEGRIVRAWDYKQKRPLVIAFLHSDCPHCAAWLEQLAASAVEIAEREAVALVIYAEPPPRKAAELGPLLIAASDATGHSNRAFLGREAFGPAGLDRVGAFVTDRYGELFGQWIARDAVDLPARNEILDTLSVIQIIC